MKKKKKKKKKRDNNGTEKDLNSKFSAVHKITFRDPNRITPMRLENHFSRNGVNAVTR